MNIFSLFLEENTDLLRYFGVNSAIYSKNKQNKFLLPIIHLNSNEYDLHFSKAYFLESQDILLQNIIDFIHIGLVFAIICLLFCNKNAFLLVILVTLVALFSLNYLITRRKKDINWANYFNFNRSSRHDGDPLYPIPDFWPVKRIITLPGRTGEIPSGSNHGSISNLLLSEYFFCWA